MATCPNCDSIVLLDHEPDIGDLVTCQECEIDLEVTNVDPLEFEVRLGDLDEEWEDEELYWEEEEEFDWEEDEWDEFDDFTDEAAFDRGF
jgi:lysine biosynthesis protein LysW